MERNMLIDIIRCIAMLWIICVWHLLAYSQIYTVTNSTFNIVITDIALGAFMFISGYLLANKYKTGDFVVFYKNRLLRILPLFFCAVMLFQNSTPIDIRMLNILAISPLLGGQMHTMWFVAILIQFYFIFPLIIYGKRWQKVTIMFIVFIVYNILGTFFPIDERIIWLFPCFAFGCLLGEMHFLDVRNKLHLKAPIQKVICFLSTASFCAYLFHRHIMVVIEKTVMPEDGIIRLFFLYVVCVPIILISGYYVQVSYNSVVQKNYINGKTRS